MTIPPPSACAHHRISCLMIASSHTGLTEKLLPLLNHKQELVIRIVGECCARGGQLSDWIGKLQPDVVLLETKERSQRSRCVQCLSMARKQHPKLNTIIVCALPCTDQFDLLVKYGVQGYLDPVDPPEQFVKAIHAVARGELWLPRRVLDHAMVILSQLEDRHPANDGGEQSALISIGLLTPREKSIADLIPQGLTNKEIARQLQISENTVKKHLKNLFEKIGIHHRSQVAMRQHPERSADS